MIYEIDYSFCALSSFIFKNFLTFALFIIICYLLLKYIISYLSNLTVILYILLITTIFAGSIVLLMLPNKEDVLGHTVVNSYYLGPLSFILLLALLLSMIFDFVHLLSKKNKKTIKKKITIEKEKIEEKNIKKEDKKDIKKKRVSKPTEKKITKTK